MVKQQFGTRFLVRVYSFQFDTSVKGEPCITVNFPRMPAEWTLTKDVTHKQVSFITDMVPRTEVAGSSRPTYPFEWNAHFSQNKLSYGSTRRQCVCINTEVT